MREINPADLVKLINEGFEGQVEFTADVQLHGNGMTLCSYSGAIVIEEDHSMNDPGRYTLASKFDQLKMMFRKSGDAVISNPDDGATRISIPFVLPQGYSAAIDNLQDIRY